LLDMNEGRKTIMYARFPRWVWNRRTKGGANWDKGVRGRRGKGISIKCVKKRMTRVVRNTQEDRLYCEKKSWLGLQSLGKKGPECGSKKH